MPTSLNLPTIEKLTNSNYMLWTAAVLPGIRGALLEGFLDGSAQAPPKEVEERVADKTIKKPNPD